VTVHVRRSLPPARLGRPSRTVLATAGLVTGVLIAAGGAMQLARGSSTPNVDAGTVPVLVPAATSTTPSTDTSTTPSTDMSTAPSTDMSTAPGSSRTGRHPVVPTVIGAPRRLQLAAAGVDAAVVPVGVGPGRQLAVPGDVRLLGWWSSGPLPGSPAGTVVIDGHVDDRGGPGALFRLARTPVGAALVLQTPAGVLRYVVQARRLYGKDQLPGDLFTAAGRPRLVLITCGGPFDRASGHYQDNVVLYALPA